MASLGRSLLSLVAFSTSVSCYLADWNETHVKNPRWPPHARFHNGQTMSMGLCLGGLTAYYTWRRSAKASGSGGGGLAAERDSITTAALLGSLYWVTGMSGILYPGTKWQDPEFGEGAPQKVVFGMHVVLCWIGWWLEMKRLS